MGDVIRIIEATQRVIVDLRNLWHISPSAIVLTREAKQAVVQSKEAWFCYTPGGRFSDDVDRMFGVPCLTGHQNMVMTGPPRIVETPTRGITWDMNHPAGRWFPIDVKEEDDAR